jgi:hypothetical protein
MVTRFEGNVNKIWDHEVDRLDATRAMLLLLEYFRRKRPLINLTNNSTNRDIFDDLMGVPLTYQGIFEKCGTCHNLNELVFVAFLRKACHKMWHVPQFKPFTKLSKNNINF